MSMLFVCGPLCSGKTTWSRAKAQSSSFEFVEISSIVKKCLGKSSRKDLLGHPELDKVIVEALMERQATAKNLIISGARQLSILEAFESFDVDYLWLEVPFSERFARFQSRDREGDSPTLSSFEEAERRENDLGLEAVRLFIASHPKGRVIKN